MGVRAETLELAILGELDEPAHGYELRRRLSESIGTLRRLSFGSLYPALHRLEDAGLITAAEPPPPPGKRKGKRAQITYTITPAGRDHLARQLETVDADDESFAVAMGLMSNASQAARLRLLKERRARVLERRAAKAAASQRDTPASRITDPWRAAQREWEDTQVDNEISWLDRLIAWTSGTAPPATPPQTPGSQTDSQVQGPNGPASTTKGSQ